MTNLSDRYFSVAVEKTLQHEGVFSDHDWDPGGATKFGITEKTLTQYKARVSTPPLRIQDLTIPIAKDIYRLFFWLGPHFDRVESEVVAVELFDTGVNCGPATAVKCLQRAYNFLRRSAWEPLVPDGGLGPKTRGAVNLLLEGGYETALVRAQNGEQYIYYKHLEQPNPNLVRKSSRGWMARLESD